MCTLANRWTSPFRDGLLRFRAQRLELHRTFWEDEDVWIESDAKMEIMYRTCAWTEGELTARLDRCEASLGYTTALCFSIERSRALWDRSGWFANTQRRGRLRPARSKVSRSGWERRRLREAASLLRDRDLLRFEVTARL